MRSFHWLHLCHLVSCLVLCGLSTSVHSPHASQGTHPKKGSPQTQFRPRLNEAEVCADRFTLASFQDRNETLGTYLASAATTVVATGAGAKSCWSGFG